MYSDYQPVKKKSKRRVLLIIGGVVAILVVSAAIGFFLSMTTSRITHDQAVKDELITQNTRLKAAMQNDSVTSQSIEQVTSTDEVVLVLKVDAEGKTYCIEAFARKDAEAVRYHMLKDTPATEPVAGLCGDNASAAPEAPRGFTLGAAGTSTASFVWNTIPEAKSYTVQCSITQNFASPVTAKATRAEGKVEGLTAGVTYFCRIGAENSAGTSEWSDVISVTTTAQLAVPKSLTISTESSTSLAYKLDAVPGAEEYILEYATDPSFTENVQRLATKQTQGVLNNLQPDKGYFFHVKVVTSTVSEQQAPFSEVVQGRTSK